jgi:hypothetical protein
VAGAQSAATTCGSAPAPGRFRTFGLRGSHNARQRPATRALAYVMAVGAAYSEPPEPPEPPPPRERSHSATDSATPPAWAPNDERFSPISRKMVRKRSA